MANESSNIKDVVLHVDSDIKRGTSNLKAFTGLEYEIRNIQRPFKFPGETSAIELLTSKYFVKVLVNNNCSNFDEFIFEVLTKLDDWGVEPSTKIVVIGDCQTGSDFVSEYILPSILSAPNGYIDLKCPGHLESVKIHLGSNGKV